MRQGRLRKVRPDKAGGRGRVPALGPRRPLGIPLGADVKVSLTFGYGARATLPAFSAWPAVTPSRPFRCRRCTGQPKAQKDSATAGAAGRIARFEPFPEDADANCCPRSKQKGPARTGPSVMLSRQPLVITGAGAGAGGGALPLPTPTQPAALNTTRDAAVTSRYFFMRTPQFGHCRLQVA